MCSLVYPGSSVVWGLFSVSFGRLVELAANNIKGDAGTLKGTVEAYSIVAKLSRLAKHSFRGRNEEAHSSCF